MMRISSLVAVVAIASLMMISSAIIATQASSSFPTIVTSAGDIIPTPVTSYYTSLVDNFASTSDDVAPLTFSTRILTSDVYWKKQSNGKQGPVLLYTGNEGSIVDFYSNTGALFSWAQSVGGLIIFLEHRYYGTSLPFGSASFTPDNLVFLTIEQALADYARIVTGLNIKYGLVGDQAVPWIAIGGSYGGVLAAFFRNKYPNIVAGAIAASAPIPYADQNGRPDTSYFAAVTADYAQVDGCVQAVRDGYSQLAELVAAGNYAEIQSSLQLCALPSAADVLQIQLWSRNALLSLAQYDYPYPTDFEGELTSYPVKAACALMLNNTNDDDDSSSSPISLFGQAVSLFYNGTQGTLPCLALYDEFIQCGDATGCGLGSDGTAWDYQVCSEFIYIPVTNGVTDMFPPQHNDLTTLTDYCQHQYHVTPNATRLSKVYGGSGILTSTTNVVYSNGKLDPFHAGGFLPGEYAHDPSNILLLIDGSAHHLDLRSSNPLDPIAVTQARLVELAQIRKWISEFKPMAVVSATASEAEIVMEM